MIIHSLRSAYSVAVNTPLPRTVSRISQLATRDEVLEERQEDSKPFTSGRTAGQDAAHTLLARLRSRSAAGRPAVSSSVELHPVTIPSIQGVWQKGTDTSTSGCPHSRRHHDAGLNINALTPCVRHSGKAVDPQALAHLRAVAHHLHGAHGLSTAAARALAAASVRGLTKDQRAEQQTQPDLVAADIVRQLHMLQHELHTTAVEAGTSGLQHAESAGLGMLVHGLHVGADPQEQLALSSSQSSTQRHDVDNHSMAQELSDGHICSQACSCGRVLLDPATTAKLDSALQQLLAIRPSLLAKPRGYVAGCMAALSRHLHVDAVEAMGMMVSTPQLLHHGPEGISKRVTLAFELVDLPASSLRATFVRDPAIMCFQPQRLAEHCEGIRAFFQLGPQDAAAFISNWPHLLHLPPDSLVPRLRSMCLALGCTPAAAMRLVRRNPGLMMQDPETLARKMEALGKALGLDALQLPRLVRLNPTLLLYSSATLLERAAGLSQLLQVTPKQLGRLCLALPTLAVYSEATLSAKLHALQEELGLPWDLVIQIAVAKPTVLGSALQKMARVWREVHALAGTHPSWMSRLAPGGMGPGTLGLLLTASEKRMQRLRYVAAMHAQGDMAISTCLAASDTQFSNKFPGFSDWMAQNPILQQSAAAEQQKVVRQQGVPVVP